MAKIFVTFGTQLPFERALSLIFEWCSRNSKEHEIFAQTCGNDYVQTGIETKRFLSPREYKEKFENADVIVAHAGMGTIITAHEMNVPIIVFPRRHELGEHRNDHQMATAKKFQEIDGVYVAYDKEQLFYYLANIPTLKAGENLQIPQRAALIKNLKNLIDGYLDIDMQDEDSPVIIK